VADLPVVAAVAVNVRVNDPVPEIVPVKLLPDTDTPLGCPETLYVILRPAALVALNGILTESPSV
jgi:hypothetical protein